MKGCKKVSIYEFIQRTRHSILLNLFVDDKSASINVDIVSVLEHQRRVTSIEGCRDSGSDIACDAVLMSESFVPVSKRWRFKFAFMMWDVRTGTGSN